MIIKMHWIRKPKRVLNDVGRLEYFLYLIEYEKIFMLLHLHIQNYAIIEEISMDFSDGLR